MRLALLGNHPNARSVWAALTNQPEHSVTSLVAPSTETASSMQAAFPLARSLSGWEELLAGPPHDLVLIAGTDEATQIGAKQLATAGWPIGLIPHAAQGSAFIYELSLIQDDNRVPLIPVIPVLSHPLVTQLKEVLDRQELGPLMWLRLERSVPAEASGVTLSFPNLEASLLEDVLLLRSLGGNYSRVTAVHSGATESGVSLSTVTLAGEGLAEATSITRVGEPKSSLIVTGANGEAELEWTSQADADAQLHFRRPGQPATTHATDQCSIAAALVTQITSGIDAATARWAEMTRAFETVEARHASLRRRRTVDLFFETTSERSIFKSHMTALGCGLLTLTLFGLIAFLLLGAFLDSRSRVQRHAESDGRVLAAHEFDQAALTPAGRVHLVEVARVLDRTPGAVFVMPDPQSEVINDERLRTVQLTLAELGHPEAAPSVSLASTPHAGTQVLLNILRIAWIAPLMVFLVLQLLLFVARPSSRNARE